jgi:chorismate mutase
MAEERDVKDPRDAVSRTAGSPSIPDGGRPALPEEPPEIAGWRRRIDLIDEQLMRLLNSRSACAVEVGRIKRTLGLPVYNPEREAAILDRVMRENPGPLDPTAVKRVFERIIDESRRLERLASEGEIPTKERG